jgi:hypothetical protein
MASNNNDNLLEQLIENGKIKGRRDYWDSASLTQQLEGEQKK